MRKLLALLLLAGSAQAASKLAIATGTFTTAGTWVSGDSAADNFSHAATTTVSTGNTDSSTFVLTNASHQRYCVDLKTRSISTGTITAHLRNSTTATNVLSVTANMSDLPSDGEIPVCFDSGGSTTPNGTDSWLIRLTCSNANCAIFYTSSGTNLARIVGLSATSAPAANDVPLWVVGFHTGAGTTTAVAVTMDDTSGNSYGSTTPPASVSIGDHGSWINQLTAGTAYTFTHKGLFYCASGGVFTSGTTGGRMPSNSSVTYLANSAANVDSGWQLANGCTQTAAGVAKTRWTTLTADVAAAATVIPVSDTTGWAAGDTLVFASTTRTASQSETKVILTVDSATQVTLTAGLTNAHSGTSPAIGEVGNLTSNVKFTGVDSTHQGYIRVDGTAIGTLTDVELNNLGSNTANKRGVDVLTTTGAFTFTNGSAHNFSVAGSTGFLFNQGVNQLTSGSITLTNNASYSIDILHYGTGFATTATGYTISGNLGILNASGGTSAIFQSVDIGGTWTNNTAVSALAYGFNLNESGAVFGTISGNSSHSNANAGFIINAAMSGTFGIGKIWRNNSFGIDFGTVSQGAGTTSAQPFIISGGTIFGNTTNNFNVQSGNGNLVVDSCTFSGDTTFSTGTGITFVNANTGHRIKILSSTFGVATGIRTAHTTGDIAWPATGIAQVDANWSTFASATVVSGQTGALWGSYLGVTGFGQSATANNFYTPVGNATTDTVIFRTASPSQRITPSSATFKMYQRSIYIPIAAGTSTATLSAYIRTSVVGDSGGANYNGSTPRLVVSANPTAGSNYNADVVCGSGGGSGSFSLVSCTLPAVTNAAMLVAYVDCDGTAGWVNVSDVTVTTTASGIGTPTYFDRGFMSVTSGASGTAGGGGGSYTFAQ